MFFSNYKKPTGKGENPVGSFSLPCVVGRYEYSCL